MYVTNEALIKELWPETDAVPDKDPYWADKNRKASLNKLQKQVSLLKEVIREARIDNTNKAYALVTPVVDILSTDLNFGKWIFRSRKGRRVSFFLGVVIAFSLVYLSFYYLGQGYLEIGKPAAILSLLQAGAVAIALVFSVTIFDRGGRRFPTFGSIADVEAMKACGYTDSSKWEAARTIAQNALEQYNRYWKTLLGSWVFLYLTIAITGPVTAASENDEQYYFALRIATTFFNNWNSLALALCYVVLHYPMAPVEGRRNRNHIRLARMVMIGGVTGIFVFALIEVILVFVSLPASFGIFEPDKVAKNADVISGLVGGMALAQYVGRIQSRFLYPPTLLPLAFYLYAVIQPLYLFIPDPVGVLIINTALILKCLLYLYMAWLFNSGRLLFYLVRVNKMFETVDAEWRGFLLALDKAQ